VILKEPQCGGFFLASPSQESWAREAATKQFCPRTQIPSAGRGSSPKRRLALARVRSGRALLPHAGFGARF